MSVREGLIVSLFTPLNSGLDSNLICPSASRSKFSNEIYLCYHTRPRNKQMVLDSLDTPGFVASSFYVRLPGVHDHLNVLLSQFSCSSLVVILLRSSTSSFFTLIHLADEWVEHSRVSRHARIYFASASAHHADVVACSWHERSGTMWAMRDPRALLSDYLPSYINPQILRHPAPWPPLNLGGSMAYLAPLSTT